MAHSLRDSCLSVLQAVIVSQITSPRLTVRDADCSKANSLVAVGDEDGGIRLLESARDGKPRFSRAYLTFRPHANAIVDLHFSSDDKLIAVASGDQRAQIIDMLTQRSIFTLSGHQASVKQIRFQPGGTNSVLATSSRDGAVKIWDLRCQGFKGPVRKVRALLAGDDTSPITTNPLNGVMTWARTVNTIDDAHVVFQNVPSMLGAPIKALSTEESPSTMERPGRRGDVSVTSFSFLQPGRENLIVTASDANACVKLWDLRTTYKRRRRGHTPLSTTQQLESHDRHRHFGLTSLALSGNGSRLYSLCRDSTIYTYSTSHLILGSAPELSSTSTKSSTKAGRSGTPEKEGLGPLYGFRHQNLTVNTFFIKMALRPASNGRSELLAVGSTEGCPIVIATDEQYMTSRIPKAPKLSRREQPEEPALQADRDRPTFSRSSSGAKVANRLNDTIPIYRHGSALVRGHDQEVTGVSWTSEGELITLSDDRTARCWREGPKARKLRMDGEREGQRWGSGWAEADIDRDDDE